MAVVKAAARRSAPLIDCFFAQICTGGKNVRKRLSFKTWMLLGALFLAASVFFAIGLGATRYSPAAIARVLFRGIPGMRAWLGEPSQLEINMLWRMRVPRVLLGMVVGASLSVCGVAMQTLMRNRLADPFVLGVSSGASAFASMFMVFGVFSFWGKFALPLSAFLGALVSIVFVYRMARVNGRIQMTRMLLSGVVVSMMMDALTSWIAVAAPDAFAMYGVDFWLSGSLAGAKWETLPLPCLVMTVCTLYLTARHRALDALSFGEETAGALGVSVATTQRILVLFCSLLAGTAICVSGSIGFLGLIVPHLCRRLVGANHRRVLLTSLWLGGSLCVWADVAARALIPPEEIPVGILTALVGAPFFLIVLRSKHRDGEIAHG